MTEAINILGSTGSIGTQTLRVCAHLGIRVNALAAGRNLDLLEQQVRAFKPRLVSVLDPKDAQILTRRLSDLSPEIDVMHGQLGNVAVATCDGATMVMAAMVGVAGLEPVLAAIRQGMDIALANKEILVAGGSIVMPLAARTQSKLLPVDSEHSAIWQCLMGSPEQSLKRILLTASGGPFRGRKRSDLADISREQALDHPTWKMGGKITIDSATLMNKGLEVIEASWLFDCPPDQIDVVVHPQSIIHSMVELADGSVMAQMGFPDMRLPIQLALTWPQRVSSAQPHFDPFDPKARTLTFEEPDRETFGLLDLAYQACRTGGTMPVVLNAANEAAVELFLAGQIGFLDIARLVEQTMDAHVHSGFMKSFGLDDMMDVDHWARTIVKEL